MTSRDRVLAACAFQAPDRIPRFDKFWEFPDDWREHFPDPDNLSDVSILVADEQILPTGSGLVGMRGQDRIERDGWGRILRARLGAYFSETLKVVMPDGVDPNSVRFDPPDLDSRYLLGCDSDVEAAELVARTHRTSCAFAKTGGPYLRTTFVRGQEQFLMDMATDVPLARDIADRVADHIAEVGVESIRRWGLRDTGIWMYDDMAYNAGPMFSPKAFEQVLLPAYRHMIARYREAGARYVFLHSDGNIMPILDMLVDAGIDGLHPLERRAGMDPYELRTRYPRLVLAGGIDNTHLLVHGPAGRIREETRRLIDLGRDGGYIIGTHSISPEVPLEHFIAYDEECRTYGAF